jgi:cytochrome c-type protein NapB
MEERADGRQPAVAQSSASVRAARRAYDGAPPVVGHEDFGMTCAACHDSRGMPVEGVGFAPASPHDGTDQAYSTVRCRQCHVFQLEEDLFVENSFVGLPQDLRPGRRLNPMSPPTIPHQILMRENCSACHSGPGARAEIATSHPERTRCRQCHVAVSTPEVFSSAAGAGYAGEENR